MSKEYHTYLSPRGIPLLYIGKPLDKPVVTLENYTKWYKIYLVMPDGSVVEKCVSDVDENHRFLKQHYWVDHLIHPRALYALADQLGGYTEERSLEVAMARWIGETGNFDELMKKENFYSPDLESEE